MKSKEEIKQCFIVEFNALPANVRNLVNYKFDVSFENGKIADVAIYRRENCIAIGRFLQEIIEDDKDKHSLFDTSYSLLGGNGTKSRYWFYYDGEKLALNDVKTCWPVDEIMKSFRIWIHRIMKKEKQNIDSIDV